MSQVISTSSIDITLERVSFQERLTHILYIFTLGLALTTLWATAETRSLEAQTMHILPPLELPPGIHVIQSDNP